MITTIINIPTELDLGCTTCGNQSIIAVAMDDGAKSEIIATACAIHALEVA